MLHQAAFFSATGTRAPPPRFFMADGAATSSTSVSSSSFLSFVQLSTRAAAQVSLSASSSDAPSPSIAIEKSVHGVSEKIVGVLGGGQLGRMLCQAASEMGIKVIVLDPMENCPARSIAHDHMVGRFDNSETVQEFAKRCDVLTVEIEHVDTTTLEKLEKQGIDCEPKASTIKIIQDKYLQKVHFTKHGIPLPEFVRIDDLESAKKAGDEFGYPLMIKSRKLAYDGRGNAVAKSEEELSLAVTALGGYGRELYVEKWAPFVKELAVIVARGRDGSIMCYPVVETIHRDNICHIVKAPASVSWKVSRLATEVAHKAVGSLDGAGIFAVELFLTKDDKILLNEVAPRPHNSGHHTIESCVTSQYEQHLRAALGLPLGDTSMKTPAAIMYNILGEDEGEPGFHIAHKLMTRALSTPGASVHWYDKPEMRKQRKMGHITIVGSSMGNVEARLRSILGEETQEDSASPRVGIIMGSDSDLPVMKEAAKILSFFDVKHEVRVVSAHRTPELMFSYAASARERGVQVIIAGAGGAAHLPGMVAALTPLPVIGVPVRASTLDGLDSLLSIVQVESHKVGISLGLSSAFLELGVSSSTTSLSPGTGVWSVAFKPPQNLLIASYPSMSGIYRMPRGVPVATVAINNATNAGLLAVRMLGASDPSLQARMAQYLEDAKNEVLEKTDRLEKVGWEAYLNP